MDLENFFSASLNLVGTFNPKIVVFLSVVCLVGEATGISIPYLLETMWLLAGYQSSKDVLSPLNLLFLVFAAQVGRQGGALALYSFSRTGSALLLKYKHHFRLKLGENDAIPVKVFRRLNLLSPLSIALGRLLWLRIPLTLALGAKRNLKLLSLGVLISSLVWDGTYIILGALVGTTTAVKPTHLFLYFFAGLTLIYGLTLAMRRLVGGLINKPATGTPKGS